MKTKLILFLTVICVMIMPIAAFGSTRTVGADEEAFEIAPVEGEGLICNDTEIKDGGQSGDAFHPNSAGNKIHLRHNGKANMAFYDGHAEAKSFEEFNAIPSAILTWGILQKKTFLNEDFSELQ